MIPYNAARFLLTFLAVLALSGCDREGESKTVLRVWDWWSPAASESLKRYFEVVERTFEERHPGVDVRYQFVPFSQYVQKLVAAVAAGNPPDTLQCSIIWARDFYDRGVLLPLNDYVRRTPELGMDRFVPATTLYNQKEGVIFGVPIAMDSYVLLYNVDFFEEAGLDASPFAIGDWDEFVEFAKKLTKRDEKGQVVRAGFLVDSGAGGFSGLLGWIYTNGGRIYNDNETRAALNSENVREVLNFFLDLYYKRRVSLPMSSERQDFNLFMQGKTAMVQAGTWSGYFLRDNVPNLNFRMTNFPPGPRGKKRATTTWGNMMLIPKGAKHPDLAWEFLTYYCGLENAINMLTILRRNSPRLDFYETEEWKKAVEENPYLEMVPTIAKSGGKYPTVRYTEMSDAFRPLYQSVMLRRKTPEEALARAEREINAILEEQW